MCRLQQSSRVAHSFQQANIHLVGAGVSPVVPYQRSSGIPSRQLPSHVLLHKKPRVHNHEVITFTPRSWHFVSLFSPLPQHCSLHTLRPCSNMKVARPRSGASSAACHASPTVLRTGLARAQPFTVYRRQGGSAAAAFSDTGAARHRKDRDISNSGVSLSSAGNGTGSFSWPAGRTEWGLRGETAATHSMWRAEGRGLSLRSGRSVLRKVISARSLPQIDFW